MTETHQISQIIESLTANLSNTTIESFYRSLTEIENQHKGNNALGSHIKMMRSIASYLQSNLSNAHPETLTFLSAIWNNAEQLIVRQDMDKPVIRKIFDESHTHFKSLKKKIASPTAFTKPEMDELNSAILAIDWEITDLTLKTLEHVLSGMMARTKPNTIFHSYLKILQSTGVYINARKSNAIADSTSLLKSVFENFERVVLSDDIALDEKKRLLVSDIDRFKHLKQKIARKPQAQPVAQMADDDHFQPALAHVKPGMERDGTDALELTELPDGDHDPASTGDEYEEITPALSGTRPADDATTDVMGDLFTVKETPADELLDAIHLMDVHGQNEDHALQMLDKTDEHEAQGIQNFTPQKMDAEPIPEIGDRLDEFFSLEDTNEDSLEFHPMDDDEPVLTEMEDTEPGIVPFDFDDDADTATEIAEPKEESDPVTETQIVEESGGTDDLDERYPEPDPDSRISTLESFLSKPGWESDRWSLQSIQKECFNVKDAWPDDPELSGLMDVILTMSRTLEDISIGEDTQETDDNTVLANTEKPKGFFAWIKGLFSS